VDGLRRKTQRDPVTIAGEVDRIYLDTEGACLIEDGALGRRIRIAKKGSRSTVVWNPWVDKAAKMGDFGPQDYRSMVCVESANAAENAVTLAPGEEHELETVIGVETLS
jgi:D-hexose-6-phosphate mutarotase